MTLSSAAMKKGEEFVLVTGGSGYIGSHLTTLLRGKNTPFISLDINEKREYSTLTKNEISVVGDINDPGLIYDLFSTYHITSIVNFAGLKDVEESFAKPDEYFAVNFEGVNNLLSIARKHRRVNFLQASTAAVYSINQDKPVNEEHSTSPISPYASAKLKAEELLSLESSRGTVNSISMRYFNVCGSSNSNLIEKKGTNLIPKTIRMINEDKNPEIYGSDYSTVDGTAIRDYIHVEDLVKLHHEAIVRMDKSKLPGVMNLGTGLGFSVKEVVSEILRQKESSLRPVYLPPREGDRSVVVADTKLSRELFNFQSFFSLEDIVHSSLF